MEISDARRLRGLEDENHRLKNIVTNQALDRVFTIEDVTGCPYLHGGGFCFVGKCSSAELWPLNHLLSTTLLLFQKQL